MIQRAALRDILAGARGWHRRRRGRRPVGAGRRGAGPGGVVGLDGPRADAVIGADGTHSVVARHLNGPLAHRYAGYTAGEVSPRWPWPTGGRRDDRTGRGGGPRADGRRPDLLVRHRAGRRGPALAAGELAYLRDKFAAWADPVPAMLAATDPAAVLRNDLYDRDPARRWADGPVVVVGDAAHPMRPHLGQGGCPLEGCRVLAAMVDLRPTCRRVRGLRVVPARRRVAGVVRSRGPSDGWSICGRRSSARWQVGRAMLMPEALVTSTWPQSPRARPSDSPPRRRPAA